MSADIIQFIPCPTNAKEQTDFPTIAFPSVVHDLAGDHVDPASCEDFEPDVGET